MTTSEGDSLDPHLKKEASPAVRGGETSGNALEASNSLRALRFADVLSRGISGRALRAFPGFFPGNYPEFLLESLSRIGGMA